MRYFDVPVALIGLVLLGPILALIALLVLLTSGRPILYRARRVGKNGRPICVYKFRTMSVDADKAGCGLTLASDARITSIGGFLRRCKLDELPQLWNVLKGDMSFVGPRPEDPRYVARYTKEQQKVLSVPPGITSPATLAFCHEQWLLRGKDVETFYMTSILPQKLAIELDYLQRRTVLTDIGVLGHTLLNLTPLRYVFSDHRNVDGPF